MQRLWGLSGHRREEFDRFTLAAAAYDAGSIKEMTDQQIEEAIAAIEAMLAARAGETAKVIEGEAEVVPSLPAPARPTKAS